MVHGERLLLVEDDGATREVLTLLLEAEGWRVTAVDSGEAALAAGVTPIVALCDLHLPGVCGPPLARALRLLAPAAVVLAMSATAQNAAEDYDGTVLKPFKPSAIETEWKRLSLRHAAGTVGHSQNTSTDLPERTATERPADGDPILDEATFLKLQQSMGDAAVRSFYAFALGDAEDRLNRMQAAADDAVFRREAHALKGSSGMMGARQLWHLAGNAEMESPIGDSADKVLRLRTAIGALRLMLETLFPV